MPITKGLIVKGLAGLTAIVGTAGGGWMLHRSGKLGSLGVGGVAVEGKVLDLNDEDKFGIPKSCRSNECELSEDQLKNIKFKELEDSTGDITVEGLVENKIKFRIENSGDQKQYPNKRKYIFENKDNSSEVKIKRGDKTVTLAKNTDSYFKGEKSTLALVETKLDIERKEKMVEVNGELGRLGLGGLKLTEKDFEDESIRFKKKTKDLYENELKNVKFKELDGAALKITFLDRAKKITIELQYDEDAGKYPKNMKFSFVNNVGYDVQVERGSKNIKIKKTESGKESTEVFKSVDGKLARAR